MFNCYYNHVSLKAEQTKQKVDANVRNVSVSRTVSLEFALPSQAQTGRERDGNETCPVDASETNRVLLMICD